MAKKKEKGKGVVISVVVIVAIVLIILGISLFSNKKTQDGVVEENLEQPLQENTDTGIIEPTEHIIEITNEGFVPKNLEIKQGDKVTWVNKLVTKVRPAGNFHPTHTVYPGSSIIKCGTAEETTIFDACKELQKDESYSFVFNEIGSWGYHNHLEPSRTGKIVVS